MLVFVLNFAVAVFLGCGAVSTKEDGWRIVYIAGCILNTIMASFQLVMYKMGLG